MNGKPDYANWIPKKFVRLFALSGGVLLLLSVLSFFAGEGLVWLIVGIVLLCAAALFLALFVYFSYARRLLSYEGGGIQGKVLDSVLEKLDWDGNGTLLDIGCGSGALAIKAAKLFPEAEITGVDYWGALWDYAKEQCERNARIEGVDERVRFEKGDAARLPFPDASFDAAVSNFVFHEVKTQPDKQALIREALRVVKPGGSFAFQDVLFSKPHYKDAGSLVAGLSEETSEIRLVDTRNNEHIPNILNLPMLCFGSDMGMICGRK
jgi:ubiquinone/menaquinone biosynthesis C-methylase UbiE